MQTKDLTNTVLIITAGIFLLESETAAIVLSVWYIMNDKPIPTQTASFISFGILYAASVLGIHTFKNGKQSIPP